jgi:hypothetical protein
MCLSFTRRVKRVKKINNSMRWFSCTFITGLRVSLLLVIGGCLLGQTPTRVTYTTQAVPLRSLSGPSATRYLQDPGFPISGSASNRYLGSQATIILYIDPDDTLPLPDTFAYEVTFQATYRGMGNPPPSRTETYTLTITPTQSYREVRVLDVYQLQVTSFQVRVPEGLSFPSILFPMLSESVSLFSRLFYLRNLSV